MNIEQRVAVEIEVGGHISCIKLQNILREIIGLTKICTLIFTSSKDRANTLDSCKIHRLGKTNLIF
jgi:hypothetical protein